MNFTTCTVLLSTFMRVSRVLCSSYSLFLCWIDCMIPIKFTFNAWCNASVAPWQPIDVTDIYMYIIYAQRGRGWHCLDDWCRGWNSWVYNCTVYKFSFIFSSPRLCILYVARDPNLALLMIIIVVHAYLCHMLTHTHDNVFPKLGRMLGKHVRTYETLRNICVMDWPLVAMHIVCVCAFL